MIWCVEDDASIRDIEIYALSAAGFETRSFEDGSVFWEALQHETPQLVLLDLMLPGMDGMTLLAKMKETPALCDIPVIVATAKGAEFDRIRGLDLGSDDYLVKPFSMVEMVSRVKAVLRRCQPKKTSNCYQSNGLVANWDEHTVFVNGERVILSFKEFELLKMLLSQPGTAYTRDQIFSRVWNTDYIGDSRTLDMHIRTLRQKLGEYGKKIETVRNVGYRWENNYDR